MALGCSKCRWSAGGCARCRNPAFKPRIQPPVDAAGRSKQPQPRRAHATGKKDAKPAVASGSDAGADISRKLRSLLGAGPTSPAATVAVGADTLGCLPAAAVPPERKASGVVVEPTGPAEPLPILPSLSAIGADRSMRPSTPTEAAAAAATPGPCGDGGRAPTTASRRSVGMDASLQQQQEQEPGPEACTQASATGRQPASTVAMRLSAASSLPPPDAPSAALALPLLRSAPAGDEGAGGAMRTQAAAAAPAGRAAAEAGAVAVAGRIDGGGASLRGSGAAVVRNLGVVHGIVHGRGSSSSSGLGDLVPRLAAAAPAGTSSGEKGLVVGGGGSSGRVDRNCSGPAAAETAAVTLADAQRPPSLHAAVAPEPGRTKRRGGVTVEAAADAGARRAPKRRKRGAAAAAAATGGSGGSGKGGAAAIVQQAFDQKNEEQQEGQKEEEEVEEEGGIDPKAVLWEPPQSPFSLIEEALYTDPWRLLLACMLLNKTSGKQVRKVIAELFEMCPTPEAAVAADVALIQDLIQPLGLFRKRARAIQRFSQEYLEKEWRDPQELYGIGQYASDAYRIFCRGAWRGPPPADKDLRRYIDWLGSTGGKGLGLERDTLTVTAAAIPSATAVGGGIGGGGSSGGGAMDNTGGGGGSSGGVALDNTGGGGGSGGGGRELQRGQGQR